MRLPDKQRLNAATKEKKDFMAAACAKLTQLEQYLTLDLSIVKGEPAANLATHQEHDKEHTSGYNKSISKQCKYCKKYGHSVDTCKKLLFKKKARCTILLIHILSPSLAAHYV
jgi:hypothetical protein